MELNRKDTINFTLRMSVDQRLQLEKIAKNEDRTVTNLINTVLKNYIERYNGVKKNRVVQWSTTLKFLFI